jgi:hypothetical protein
MALPLVLAGYAGVYAAFHGRALRAGIGIPPRGEFPKNFPCEQGRPAVSSTDFGGAPLNGLQTVAANDRFYRTVSLNSPSIRKE